MSVAQHRKFDLGINQDLASYLLGEGFLVDSKNIIFDKLGIARKRGGIVGIGATASTYNWDHLGLLLKDDGTTVAYALRCAGGGSVYTALVGVNLSTGAVGSAITTATTNLGVLQPDGGRPFQHYGFMVFPCYNDGSFATTTVGLAFAGGSNTGGGYLFTAGCTLTAGDKRVLCNVADNPLTNMRVGDIYVSTTGGTPNYVGRVTALIDSTHFEVYPTPTTSIVTINSSSYPGGFVVSNRTAGAEVAIIGGKVGMSYQGRVLLGYCSRLDALGTARQELYARRVYFSSTLLEADATGNARWQGMVALSPNGFPNYNYFDIPGNDPLTAMSPTGFGDAVFFSATRAYRLTGNLSTQYGTSQSVTWAVKEIPNSVGCLSERSMQRTPRGVIFAHDSGIYSTDGASMQPIMLGRIQNLWKNLVAGTGFKIYGSGLVRGNHYYICGTSGGSFWGLLVNLDTLAWGPLGGKTTAAASWIPNSLVQDPAAPSKVYGLKWWDKTAAPPSMTTGQLLTFDTIFSPTTLSADADGQTVGFGLVTAPYSEGFPTVQKIFQKATIEYKNTGGATITVIPDYSLDAPLLSAAAGATSFLLGDQQVYTVTAATNATPIVLTTSIAHQIRADTWVYVKGVTGNTNANGKFRVAAVGAFTITLIGSYGNGAYISGGTVQTMDQRDIPLVGSGTLEGEGVAVSYRISNEDTGPANAVIEFELRGITHTYDQRDASDE